MLAFLAAGCKTAPIEVTPKINQYGIPECSINGEVQPLSEMENRMIISEIVELYCGLE